MFCPGSFSGYVGSSAYGYDGVRGDFNREERNRNDERVLEFVDSFDVVVGKTFFKTDAKKLIAYKSEDKATVSDYVVIPKEVLKNVRDAKVALGEECFLQYSLLIMELSLEDRLIICAVRKMKNPGRVKFR